MRWLALFLLIPLPALGETWIGSAHVVDGDTIYVHQTRLRLLSMDAFESAQTCRRDGAEYPCGEEATRALIKLIGRREIRCEGDRRDRYRRPLVHCWLGSFDLGREMVRLGWALAEFGPEYRQDEKSAHTGRVGAWAGTFERPKDWRKLHQR